jgi:hypothetical protein
VVLYGGRRITQWRRDGDRFWTADLPGVREGTWDFRALVVDGRLAPRARLPKEGRFEHLNEFNVRWMSTTYGGWERKPTEEELTTLRYRPGDLGPWLDIRSAELTVYHQWDESVVGLRALDDATHTVRFSNPAGHPPGGFANRSTGAGKTYVVWNVREGMTEPGQWYLDRPAGRLVYWPLPGEDMATAHVVAPAARSVVRLAGREDEPVRDVALRGLRIVATTTPLVAGGFGAAKFDGAVEAECAHDCRFEGLTVASVGGHGVRLQKCPGARVEGCETHATGAGGIYVGGEGAVIEDCLVEGVGILYPSALGVRAGGGMRIAHNEIRNTSYSAVCASGGEGTVIENNLFRDVMTVLHDGAAIYVTFCKRYVVRGNVTYDIPSASAAHAYYLDEQAEDCVVDGNLAVNCCWPSHNHMARRNAIRDNVFVHEGDMELTFMRCEDFTFERNVLYAGGRIVLKQFDAIASMPDNVLFSRAGRVEVASGKDYATGDVAALVPRQGTVIADPLFVDAARGDFRFRAGSPGVARGIKPAVATRAGRRVRER